MIIVSFSPMVTLLNSPIAIRVNADMGSPCEPVDTIKSSPSKRFFVFSISINTPSGIFNSPIFTAASTTLNILLPDSATLRRYFTPKSMICCKRCTLDAKVAIINLRFIFSENKWSRVIPTTVSLMVYPGRSIFVDSLIYSNTPSLPSSAIRLKSIGSPATGVRSILKSPLW